MSAVVQGAWIASLSWPEVENRIRDGALGVLPVGAACKEHGPHLPLNTDQIQVEWCAGQLAMNKNVLIWPTVTYGYYPSFMDYPGSCTLAQVSFVALMRDILHSVLQSGIDKIIILNSGISTIEPLSDLVAAAPFNGTIFLFNLYSGPLFVRAQRDIEQQQTGQHADEIETSIMLAIAPERVNMALAVECLMEKQAGPLNRTDPRRPNYSPNGVLGNARLATAEKGRRLATAILDDLDNFYNQI